MTPSSRKDVSSGGVSVLMAPDAVKSTPNDSMVRGLEIVSPKLAAKSPKTLSLEKELFIFLFSFHCFTGFLLKILYPNPNCRQ